MLFSAQYALYRVLERFAADPLAGARIPLARNTMEAATSYMPFGSGMGTFVSVYGMFEKRQDTLVDKYANHAHNDLLQLWLEAGALGIVLVLLFIIWLVLRSVRVWRNSPGTGRGIDLLLPRAATLIIPLIIAHSFFDYPLRTGAMMAIFAYACALLIDPPLGVEGMNQVAQGIGEDLKAEQAVPPRASAAPPDQNAPPPGRAADVTRAPSRPRAGKWGEEIEWPEEWQKPANKTPDRGPGPKPGPDKPSGK
jgi:hypothetical protein